MWTCKMSKLLGVNLTAPFNTEVLACNEGTLSMFKAALRLALPMAKLSNPTLAASSPTLLALFDMDSNMIHGLWIAEHGTAHAPKVRVCPCP